jgi:ketosteroid isomerase-like protein
MSEAQNTQLVKDGYAAFQRGNAQGDKVAVMELVRVYGAPAHV